jgi:lipopolysaccharide transport system ATP-binding protein
MVHHTGSILPQKASRKFAVTEQSAVRVENVSKCYTIWSSPAARLHGPLLGRAGQLPFLPARLRNSCRRLSREAWKNFFALRGVSFEVRPGQCVGIVGRNGSGKSTLLQIIAGTLEPTAGTVTVRGRVAAVLELGSGFNPEFSGRENVYLNGAVLGMSRQQVRAKFDEIAAFADIGEFIDQPIKTYSSGMLLRLAFAVQAVLEPDVLIVDETLAVGDEAFQRKCFARLEALRRRGCTILLVTHAANVVVQLCQRAMLLERGEKLLEGPPKPVVAWYHKLLFAPPEQAEAIRGEIRALGGGIAPELRQPAGSAPRVSEPAAARAEEYYDPHLVPKSTVTYPSRGATIHDPQITTLEGRRVNGLVRGAEYIYRYTVRFHQPACGVRFGMMIKTVTGYDLGGAVTHPVTRPIEFVDGGSQAQVRFRFRCLLQSGVYFLNAGVLGLVQGNEVYLHRQVDAAMFRVQAEPEPLGTGVVDFSVTPTVTITAGEPTEPAIPRLDRPCER